MKRRKDFDSILDECLERIIARGETVEQCLAGYPEHAAQLEPLLQTALAAREATAIRPRSEFMERARYQFQSAIREMELKPRGVRWFFGWQPAWVTTVIVILVFLLAGGGTTAAASNSMPDETLYPVKLATEKVRLVLTPSALGKAELYVKFADNRVAEIIKMADEGKTEQVEEATQRLDTQLIAMANLAAPVAEGPSEPEAATLEAPAPQGDVAEVPEPEVQEVPRAAMREAPAEAPQKGPPEEVQKGPPKAAQEVLPEAPGRGGGPPEEVGKGGEDELGKQASLKGVLANRAFENTEALRAALNRVPESVKPALIEAIEVAGAGYERALMSLD